MPIPCASLTSSALFIFHIEHVPWAIEVAEEGNLELLCENCPADPNCGKHHIFMREVPEIMCIAHGQVILACDAVGAPNTTQLFKPESKLIGMRCSRLSGIEQRPPRNHMDSPKTEGLQSRSRYNASYRSTMI